MDAVDKTGEANFQRTGQFDPLFLLLESSPTSKVQYLMDFEKGMDQWINYFWTWRTQFQGVASLMPQHMMREFHYRNSQTRPTQPFTHYSHYSHCSHYSHYSQLLNLCALISVHQNAGAISVAESFKIEHMKLTREQPESITQQNQTTLSQSPHVGVRHPHH